MQHVFNKGTKNTTFLLLHGTGGDERSLLGLAQEIDAGANVLSVRGNVLENGMPRFFRRIAEGIFDMEDLALRTRELYDFIDEAAAQYDFDRQNVIAIGYSNGANIAANLLYTKENALRGAILHHPMVPNKEAVVPKANSIDVWIGAGTNDFMCPAAESILLEAMLQQAGVSVETAWFDYGHQLTMPEVQAAKQWYEKTF